MELGLLVCKTEIIHLPTNSHLGILCPEKDQDLTKFKSLQDREICNYQFAHNFGTSPTLHKLWLSWFHLKVSGNSDGIPETTLDLGVRDLVLNPNFATC